MNQRIQELAEQASTFAFTEYPKQTMATFNTNKSVDQLFNQKFAQLIVAECADIANKQFSVATGLDDRDCWTAAEMKKHFGVEQ